MGEGEIDELGESRVDKDGHLRDGKWEYAKLPNGFVVVVACVRDLKN
jgi:hypothetical protein